MRNRLALTLILGCVLLAACDTPQTVVYTYKTDQTDASRNSELAKSVERMVNRRIAALDIKPDVTAIPTSASEGKVTMILPTAESADHIRTRLDQPFTIDFRVEVPATQPATGTGAKSDAPSDWKVTGIGNKDLDWIQLIGNKSTGQIGIELVFTPEGHARLDSVFHENNGKTLGIFVRDLLVSKLIIQGSAAEDRVTIFGLPNQQVAQAFVDDVNVGLHVAFSPQQ